MHLNGVPYFVQPPLYFWAGAAFSLLFGHPSAFALRLPSALATIALSALTGYAVARQAGTRVGAYAAVILSTCLMQTVIGRLAIMDALLDLAVAMTIFWWFRGLETGRDRYHVYGWIAAGGGFLAKGLVAPALALLVIVPYYLWNRRCEPTQAPSPRAWIFGLLRLRPDRRAVADRAGRPLPTVAHREADRRIHRRALHRGRRKPVRTRLVLLARHHPRLLPVDSLPADGDRQRRRAAALRHLGRPADRAASAPLGHVDRRASPVLQLRANEASELRRARVSRAGRHHGAVFRGSRTAGAHALGGHLRRHRPGDDRRAGNCDLALHPQ